MARRPSTWLQVSAHRLTLRRMEHALVRRDVALHDDPLRAQSLALVVGAVIAALVVGGCLAVAVITPRGDLGSARIVVARESGAVFVRVDGVWHPTPNLASARLLIRAPDDPTLVAQRALDDARRGPTVGIPGAPATLGVSATWDTWVVCDGGDTVVTAGDDSAVDGFDSTRSVLVTPRGESAAVTYLLFGGRRAAVDLRTAAVVRALRLDGVVPQPVSRALLDTVPEVAPIVVPNLERAGLVGPTGSPVGAVVQVTGAASTDLYVVLAAGVQRVGEVAADMIRLTYAGGSVGVPAVSPAAIAAAGVVDRLPLAHLPDRAVTPVSGRTVCVRWRGGNSEVLVGTPPDTGSAAIELPSADGSGPLVDRVLLPKGRTSYVRSARAFGDDGTGPTHLVTDSGAVYGVRDEASATALGLDDTPVAAPWPVLAWLPRGPELSIEGAGTVRDGGTAPA